MPAPFQILTKKESSVYISVRKGEQKLGEALHYITQPENWEKELAKSEARFCIVGAAEDIGIRANYGIGGAHKTWTPFLKSFLNIQNNARINADAVMVLGAFDFSRQMQTAEQKSIFELRELVEEIDENIYPVIQKIVTAGKIPVLIGGGHNNAFPLLKGASLALKQKLNAINLDAHSDYRAVEGRHSGNGFRYAKENKFLAKYAVVGLHENYNSGAVLKELAHKDFHISFYEDIFLRKKQDFNKALGQAIQHVKDKSCGIELDLDCIERALSSAATPCGIPALDARHYLTSCLQQLKVAYIHLTEGVCESSNGQADNLTAKLLAYLVSDCIKA